MADFFYDGQVRRYLTQFMRIMSNFSYKDAKGNLTQVPVRYGDMSRQTAAILTKNSENVVQSAPFIACYIKDLQFNRDMLQDPTYVSKVQIRERAYDSNGKEYLNTQGANYTVERIMPSPYIATFAADIWTTNTDQKLQLWEQIVILFNPALELQTTDNFLDWTSLTYLELASQQFETRTVPQGLESDISICNMTFTAPIWITPPAKVKQLGIITKIITGIFTDIPGPFPTSEEGIAGLLRGQVTREKVVVSPGNFDLLVLNHVATLLPTRTNDIESGLDVNNPKNKGNWKNLLDLYPGQFIAGLSQLRLTKPDGNEVVAFISLNPTDEQSMMMNIDADTIPTNTIIGARGSIDAIINPQTFDPVNPTTGTRYLILEDINAYDLPSGTDDTWRADAWRSTTGTSFVAHANDIIEWNGSQWAVIFDSRNTSTITYITNSYTSIQYKWDGTQWSKSYEGVYDKENWRLIL
jgi:hypothetical protein